MDVWGDGSTGSGAFPYRLRTPCVTLGSDFICLGLSFLSQRRRIIIASASQGCLSINES